MFSACSLADDKNFAFVEDNFIGGGGNDVDLEYVQGDDLKTGGSLDKEQVPRMFSWALNKKRKEHPDSSLNFIHMNDSVSTMRQQENDLSKIMTGDDLCLHVLEFFQDCEDDDFVENDLCNICLEDYGKQFFSWKTVLLDWLCSIDKTLGNCSSSLTLEQQMDLLLPNNYDYTKIAVCGDVNLPMGRKSFLHVLRFALESGNVAFEYKHKDGFLYLDLKKGANDSLLKFFNLYGYFVEMLDLRFQFQFSDGVSKEQVKLLKNTRYLLNEKNVWEERLVMSSDLCFLLHGESYFHWKRLNVNM